MDAFLGRLVGSIERIITYGCLGRFIRTIIFIMINGLSIIEGAIQKKNHEDIESIEKNMTRITSQG